MEKKIIKINNVEVTIMEQPTSTIIAWEKKYAKDPVEYARQILKYPNGVNKDLEEILNAPKQLKALNLVKKYENENELLKDCQVLLVAGGNNYAFAGEKFVELLDRNVDDFKFKELVQIGKEIETQIMFFGEIGTVIETFRNF